jgi:tight adherence protein B
MVTILIYLTAFVAVVLAVQTAAEMYLGSRDKQKRVNRRLTLLAAGMKSTDVYATLVRNPAALSTGSTWLNRISDAMWTFCRQAGIQISPVRMATYFGSAVGIVWLVSLLLIQASDLLGYVVHGTFSLVVSVLVCALAAFALINRRRNKRLLKFEEQMPLALDVVNRAIRAGHPVISAVQLAGNELGDPLGSEFGLIVDETTYGFTFADALMNFAQRTGSQDARYFAVAVAIQSETGGNLAEILEGLAKVIRGRGTLSKRVKALSSEGRTSAVLLTVLPVLVVGGIFLMYPAFYTSKFSDPIFWPSVFMILLLYFLGWFVIHRIVNFRY